MCVDETIGRGTAETSAGAFQASAHFPSYFLNIWTLTRAIASIANGRAGQVLVQQLFHKPSMV